MTLDDAKAQIRALTERTAQLESDCARKNQLLDRCGPYLTMLHTTKDVPIVTCSAEELDDLDELIDLVLSEVVETVPDPTAEPEFEAVYEAAMKKIYGDDWEDTER